jgi:hypothetical protein
VKAEQETEELRQAAENGASQETIKSARTTLARATRLDAELAEIVDEAQAGRIPEEARWYTRTRFRLVRATADLWLMLDNTQGERRRLH